MRSRNQYGLFSNWSQPVLLNISEVIATEDSPSEGML